MSRVFRAKMLAALRRAYRDGEFRGLCSARRRRTGRPNHPGANACCDSPVATSRCVLIALPNSSRSPTARSRPAGGRRVSLRQRSIPYSDRSTRSAGSRLSSSRDLELALLQPPSSVVVILQHQLIAYVDGAPPRHALSYLRKLIGIRITVRAQFRVWLAAPGFVPPRFIGGRSRATRFSSTDETLNTPGSDAGARRCCAGSPGSDAGARRCCAEASGS